LITDLWRCVSDEGYLSMETIVSRRGLVIGCSWLGGVANSSDGWGNPLTPVRAMVWAPKVRLPDFWSTRSSRWGV